MRWQDESVPLEERAFVPAPNTFISQQRDRTLTERIGQYDKHIAQMVRDDSLAQQLILSQKSALRL